MKNQLLSKKQTILRVEFGKSIFFFLIAAKLEQKTNKEILFCGISY